MHGELLRMNRGLLPSLSIHPVLAARPEPRTAYGECMANGLALLSCSLFTVYSLLDL